MAQKRNFASAFKSGLVTVYVGPDKQKYTPHQKILTRAKFFATSLDASSREHKEKEISLPEEEPEVFERLLEYLYQDRIDAEVFGGMGPYDSEYLKREDQATVLMAKVWVAAEEYCMEECQNHVTDYFLKHLSIRWPRPGIFSKISKRGFRESKLRELIMEHLAARLLGQGSGWENALHENCDIMRLVYAGGMDAYDFFRICMAWVFVGRTEKVTAEHCKWHVHKTTEKCPLPADEEE